MLHLNWTPKQVSRFWSKVDQSGGEDACWEWQAGRAKGYGRVRVWYKTKPAHRVAYVLANGAIPDDKRVCHACDNPACVNPRHLWLGTDADNMRDASAKGRMGNNRGIRNGNAKLTEADVQRVREMLANGIRQADIADAFGISQSLVSKIKRGLLHA